MENLGTADHLVAGIIRAFVCRLVRFVVYIFVFADGVSDLPAGGGGVFS